MWMKDDLGADVRPNVEVRGAGPRSEEGTWRRAFDATEHAPGDAPLGEANIATSVNTLISLSTTILPCPIRSVPRLEK